MTNAELNEMIEWCRKKIQQERTRPCGMRPKELDGYTTAMKAVMSYLHSLKETNDGREKLANSKADTAREIFEEMDEIFLPLLHEVSQVYIYVQLKRKYTGDAP